MLLTIGAVSVEAEYCRVRRFETDEVRARFSHREDLD